MPAVYRQAAAQPGTQTGCRSRAGATGQPDLRMSLLKVPVEEAPLLQHDSITTELGAVCGK
jgi:hypothetical protein